jgi:hypothetical protein
MNRTRFAIATTGALFLGLISYFVIEGISLHRKNKKAASLKSSITELENAKALVEAEEEKGIVEESLGDELKKKEEITANIEKSKNRLSVVANAAFRLLPSVLDLAGAVISSDSSSSKEEKCRRIEGA